MAPSNNVWRIGHKDLTNWSYQLTFDNTSQALNVGIWDSTPPTDLVVNLGPNPTVNSNNQNYIAYCFAEVEGFSKFSRYIGNGNADGPFVYCGFKPNYILVKRIDSKSDWVIYNIDDITTNPNNSCLIAQTTSALVSSHSIDILSNGFKVRNTTLNVNNGTYIFAAFAEAPFKYATSI